MAITHGRNNSLLALIDQLENNDPKSIIHEKDSIFFYYLYIWKWALTQQFTLKSNTLQMLFKRWFVFEGIYNSAESKNSCYRKYRLDQMPNFVKQISFSRTDHVLTK